jgi:cell shape-determining protein MreD
MRSGGHSVRHVAAWLLVMVMAIVNGTIRDFTYGRLLGERLAHSLSVIPLLVAIFALAIWLARRWPLPSPAATAAIGAIWLAFTLGFEFGLGTAAGRPMRDLLAQYDLLRGNLWPLIPVAMAVAPAIARRVMTSVVRA